MIPISCQRLGIHLDPLFVVLHPPLNNVCMYAWALQVSLAVAKPTKTLYMTLTTAIIM